MKRALWMVGLLLIGSGVAAAPSTKFYFAQVADGTYSGGFWKTTIFITNPAAVNTSLASGSITLTASNGSAFGATFVDDAGRPASTGNTIAFQIAGGQTRKYVSVAAGPLSNGFATVTASAPVIGTAVFSQFSAGRLVSEAGVPGSTALPRQSILVDTLGGFKTAVAYANPAGSAVSPTLRLLTVDGVTVLTTTRALASNTQEPLFVNELFPTAPEMVGTLQITAQTGLAAIALRFSPDFSVFTTLPPVQIAGLMDPFSSWFRERPWVSPFTSVARLLSGLRFRIG